MHVFVLTGALPLYDVLTKSFHDLLHSECRPHESWDLACLGRHWKNDKAPVYSSANFAYRARTTEPGVRHSRVRSRVPQSHLGARRGTCASAAVCTVTVHAAQAAPASPARSRPRGLAVSFLFLSPQDVTPSARSRHSALNPTCFLSPASLQGYEPAPSGERTQETVVETVKEKACIPEHALRGPWLPRAPPAGDPLAHSSFYPLFGPSAKRQFCAVSDLPSFQFYYLCIRCLSDFSTEETNIYLCKARPPILPAETPSPTPQGSRLLLQQPCDLEGGGC